jgi:hypothetical protein
LSATTTALDMVWHVMHASVSRQLFDSYLSHSLHFRTYEPGPPLRLFWQIEAKTADRLRLLVLEGKYGEVERGLDAVYSINRDDVALELVMYLSDARLVSISGTAAGRGLLERLYDELTSGVTSDEEAAQAQRILVARTAATVTPEMFDRDVAPGGLRVFPYRKGGITVRPAIPWASFIGGGKVFVRMSINVRTDPTFDEDTKTLPLEVFTGKGMVLEADQIVGVRFYDEGGGAVQPVPALQLVALKNEGVTHTFEKIGETAGLALGVVGGSAEAVSLGARVLLWADRIANVLGPLGRAISENRGWFIRTFGKSGRQFVERVEMANGVISLFGVVRTAMSLPKIVTGLREVARGLRRSATELWHDLTAGERTLVTNSATEADELATSLAAIRQAQAEIGAAGPAEPGASAMGEPPSQSAGAMAPSVTAHADDAGVRLVERTSPPPEYGHVRGGVKPGETLAGRGSAASVEAGEITSRDVAPEPELLRPAEATGELQPSEQLAEAVGSLGSIQVARRAGVPELVYGDAWVLTLADLPDLEPHPLTRPTYQAPPILPTTGRSIGSPRARSTRLGGRLMQDLELRADLQLTQDALRRSGARIIRRRMNQEQILEGLKVGENRPDLALEIEARTKDGHRIFIEYDRARGARPLAHARRILSNDPDAIVILKIVDF